MRWVQLESLLRRDGVLPAASIAAALGVSQPTVSRLLARAGERIVRIGRARAARYALAREIARMGSHWPLYRIDANARSERVGELYALHGDDFFFVADGQRPALTHGDFALGLYPDLPWFLADQRPQGFLGRAFAQRVAADIGAPADILIWRDDDVVLTLLRNGDDALGDLVLGDASLRRALHAILDPRDTVPAAAREARYPDLAELVLGGAAIGSSAAGEQPKFAVTLQTDEAFLSVIVKFSDRVATPAGRRWADLLIAEHHAGVVLRQHGLPAAETEIVQAGGRVFLQSTRFDRTPRLGRRGLVSLAALDAAYYGHGSLEWRAFASQLQHDGWLDEADARRLRVISWYGSLIANGDMHLGNASLHLADRRPFTLAPVYDMLPMRFRPLASGEVVARRYEIALPMPGEQAEWREAARMALAFWQRIGDDPRISAAFRSLGTEAAAMIERAQRDLGA